MKVIDLIEKLHECNPEDLVLLSSDEEGNSYKALAQIDEANCEKDGWEYYIGIKELTPQHVEWGYSEDDINHGEGCIVLYP